MNMLRNKPEIYIHTGQATHFLKWEVPIFKKYFKVVDAPSKDTILFAFGPDIIDEATKLPARLRIAYILPGFGMNPVYNLQLREETKKLIESHYDLLFINPGPLEIAYKDLEKTRICNFGISPNMSKQKRYRKRLDSLLHLSSDFPQKDWQRSERIMQETGLKYEVFPPRSGVLPKDTKATIKHYYNSAARQIGISPIKEMPLGYVSHRQAIKKYLEYDGFVHVAKNIEDKIYIDGKYTASLIEAGATGSILFWHDTFGLGNGLETVFNLSLDEPKAAQEIMDIRSSIDIFKHSKNTREEMLSVFSASESVRIRAEQILALL